MMVQKFDAYMRKLLLVPAGRIGKLVGLLVLVVFGVVAGVIWKVNSDIAQGSQKYFEEIARSLSNTIAMSIEASCYALEAVGSGHFSSHHDEEVHRLYERLSLETMLFVDKDGFGEGHNNRVYDFRHVPEIMEALKGKTSVFDCKYIHDLDGTHQKKSHLALAVPLVRGNEIRGAVVADVGERWGNNLMNAVLMGGNMMFAIFEKSGGMLIKSNDFLSENSEYNTSVDIRSMMENLRYKQIGEQIDYLLKHPTDELTHFHYVVDGQRHDAIVVPLHQYEIYVFVVTAGTFGVQEFASMDRMVSYSYVSLLLLLCVIIVILSNIFRYSRNLALVDPVTGGMSSLAFEMEFRERLGNSLPNQYTYFRININKFKLFNDFFGRKEGDRLLQMFFNNMKAQLPGTNARLCRAGTDEFDLLTCDVKTEYVLSCLEKAVEATTESLVSTRGNRIDYSFSIRVGARPIQGPDADYVMVKDRAGIAMERANKPYGNNIHYAIFEEEDMQRARRERNIENCMQQSLEDEDFFVMLQPKVILQTGCICGAEALVRWYHPQLGRIFPNEFIPIFERNGFINKLDMWVFTKVCSLMHRWQQRGWPLVPVSVNLSHADIDRRNDLAKELASIADEYGIPHEYLDLEITETTFYKDPATIQRSIDSIRNEGFQCSLDDFGSGYSSLNLLPDLRIDTLKIDKSFFSSQELNRGRDRVVIKMVVELARQLGIKVVAEGVETMAQRNFLCQCSCTVGQGYLYSKPILPDEFELMAFEKKRTLC